MKEIISKRRRQGHKISDAIYKMFSGIEWKRADDLFLFAMLIGVIALLAHFEMKKEAATIATGLAGAAWMYIKGK